LASISVDELVDEDLGLGDEGLLDRVLDRLDDRVEDRLHDRGEVDVDAEGLHEGVELDDPVGDDGVDEGVVVDRGDLVGPIVERRERRPRARPW
jgi:hypothetical protein